MSDYISREAAIMAVTRAKLPDVTPEGVPIANGKRSVTDCVRRLKEIPAADVRPVVLCRDCGHWNGKNQHPSKWSGNSVAMCAWFSRNYGTIETSEGVWCSYGYRREES